MLKLLLLFTLVALIQADFKQECLQAHNKYRAMHSAPALRIDNNLQNTAQIWANYLANNNIFKHSGRKGENIYASSSKKVNGRKAVDSWYNEVNLYDFKNPGYSSDTGHFTQLVWINSKKLGCAKAVSKDGKRTYVVANYDPIGNVRGKFRENVKPKK